MYLVAGNSSETRELFTKRHGVTYQNTWIITVLIMSDLADLFNIGQMLDVERDSMEQKVYRNENLEGRE
jgi:hypothetical protein